MQRVPRWPHHGRRGTLTAMPVLTRSAVRRGFDSIAHRVLYTLLLAMVSLAVIVLVVPVVRRYSGTNEQVIALAILLVLLVETVGSRLRRFVDWLLYGQRGNAAVVSSRLAVKLESVNDDVAVPALVAALADTLRLSYVAVLADQDGESKTIATVGTPTQGATHFPVRHSGQELGELRAGRRGETLNHQDVRMLSAAAAQLGVVMHAASLAVELQNARERLVSSREDERRRLRRELHDGVGPTLAGIALGLDSANRAIGKDQQRATDLIAEIRGDVTDLVVDVRRVVDGLRPPMLDEVGLAGALTQLGEGFGERAGCSVEVRVSDLPSLSAAVEVAAYRIGAEALTNVFKHAHSTRCDVSVVVSEGILILDVIDNGVGGALTRDGGIGLPSTAERAAELGGDLKVESKPSGTHLRARLPLAPAAQDE
jgi:signal transduction histidine kinase